MEDVEVLEYEQLLANKVLPNRILTITDKADRRRAADAFRKRAHRFDIDEQGRLLKDGKLVLKRSTVIDIVLSEHRENGECVAYEKLVKKLKDTTRVFVNGDEVKWILNGCEFCRRSCVNRTRMPKDSLFKPIDTIKQKALCVKLNRAYERYCNKRRMAKEESVMWRKSPKYSNVSTVLGVPKLHLINNLDNRCFYRCISVVLTGTEEHWKILQCLSIEVLKARAEEIARFLKCSVDFLQVNTFEGNVGTNCGLWVAMALLLEVDIINNAKILEYKHYVRPDWFHYPADLVGGKRSEQAIYLASTKYHVDLVVGME